MDYYLRLQRGRFTIVQRVDRNLPTQTVTTIKDPRLDSINKRLKRGDLTPPLARKMARTILDQYREAARPKELDLDLLAANSELLEEYWRLQGHRKKRRDQMAAYLRIKRALRALGPHPLVTTPPGMIEKLVEANIRGIKPQRDALSALTTLLRFKDISYILHKPEQGRPRIRYVTFEEFRRLVAFVDDDVEKLVFWVGFCTGARVGEIFHMERQTADRKMSYIEWQLTDNLKQAPTKTGADRWAYVIAEGREKVTEWVALPDKASYRQREWSRIMARASLKAGLSRMVFHDLRHSYAVHLLQAEGLSLEKTARFLGNSIVVCERYYTGFRSVVADGDGLR